MINWGPESHCPHCIEREAAIRRRKIRIEKLFVGFVLVLIYAARPFVQLYNRFSGPVMKVRRP